VYSPRRLETFSVMAVADGGPHSRAEDASFTGSFGKKLAEHVEARRSTYKISI
jgi:hypothetical protein